MYDLNDRVALVTGGGAGIGQAMTMLFAQEGVAVGIADLDLDAAEQTVAAVGGAGGRALALQCDVARRAEVETVVSRTLDEFGAIDFLVTCAGNTRDNLIHKMTEDDWNAVIDTHLRGTFLCAQAAQRHMVPRRFGKMVFISSPSARGQRGQSNYSAAKAGIRALAATLAIELGPFNINVNAVAPGFVDTPMTRRLADRLGIEYDELKRQREELTPLRRIALPLDIANVILFLCTAQASYISGQTITVRGGP